MNVKGGYLVSAIFFNPSNDLIINDFTFFWNFHRLDLLVDHCP